MTEFLTTAERRDPRLDFVITPETLLADNATPEARRLRDEWGRNRERKNLWAIVACGDARLLIPRPDNIISVRSIAAAGKKERQIFEDQGIKLIVVMSHVDGDTIVHGKQPTGCGGLAAKEQTLNDGHEKPIEGLQHYIDNNIDHPDPTIQALVSAQKITKETGKPSLAVIQNHRTGAIYPFAVFTEDCQIISSDMDLISLMHEYDERKIYANGIPKLPTIIIPEIFKEFMEANDQYSEHMLRQYPNLKDMQRVQNPRMVVISSKLPSIRTRYPDTAKYPGVLFKLHLPREKNGSQIKISTAAQREIIAQAQYPIQRAVENFGEPQKPFANTDRFLIETSDIEASIELAKELAKKPWMREWLTLEKHLILVAQNQEGASNRIERFVLPKP